MKNNALFQLWKVSDEEEYKLKLQGQQISELEAKLGGKNLMMWLGDGTSITTPLRVMLMIIHGAMARYHHGIKMQDVYSIFDRYVDNGGTVVSLYSDVFVPLFLNSGFFPIEQTETTAEKAEE